MLTSARIAEEVAKVSEIMKTDRALFIEVLSSESTLGKTTFERDMDYLAAKSKDEKSFDRVAKISPHYYICVDGHSVGRYNTRVLERRKESYVKKHHALRDCPRFATDLLIEKVTELLKAGAMRQMREQEAEIFFDEESEDVVATRDDVNAFVVGFEGSETRYVLAYSFRCIFVLTVVCSEDTGKKWENVMHITIPVE